MPRGAISAVLLAGLVAVLFVPLDRPGIGWLPAGSAIVGMVYLVDRKARRATARTKDVDTSSGSIDAAADRPSGRYRAAEPGAVPVAGSGRDESNSPPEATSIVAPQLDTCLRQRSASAWWITIAMGLLAVGAFRAAEWLFVLCLLGAGVAGSLAVVRRSIHGLLFDMIAVPVSGLRSVPWLHRGVRRVREQRVSTSQRVGWSVVAAVAMLAIFVPLLAGADAMFARLVHSVTPRFDAGTPVRWAFVFTAAALLTAGAMYLLAGPPAAATDSVAGRLVRRRWSRLEWGLPLGTLTAVFALFVATQLAALFGGSGYVQRTAGLTYAEYARSGFWQLSAVSLLALGVIAAVQAWAAQESARDRRWLRVGVAAVSVLTLVIVASALHRMWTYQQAYGFTVLRLLVEVFELWIGLVYLLVLAALMRLRRTWVPRAAVGAAAMILLSLALANPERLVAERNIDRWQSGATVGIGTGSGARETGPDLDIDYLGTLSPDALPAIERLPEPQRGRIVGAIRAGLGAEDSWQEWNRSRSAAR